VKIVILGAGGQLGRHLARSLSGEIAALTRAQGDLTQPAELRQTLQQLKPQVVVNAAAYTAVDRAESEPDLAFAVNARGVRNLAEICRDLDAALVHISTDYVFGSDMSRHTPYGETDEPGPINVYGQSKLAGERFVAEISPRHFILRTCGLYAAGSNNFVTAMLRKARQGEPVRVVEDQICTPTSVADFAAAIAKVQNSNAYGLYHVTNSGACSWHEFAKAIFALVKVSVNVEAICSAEYAALGRRPLYSVLSTERWTGAIGHRMRSWQEALEGFFRLDRSRA
jgi:dTDP-4-dehydrorhamnose reductase